MHREQTLQRVARGAVLALAISTALTVSVVFWRGLELAWRARELHVALETTGGLVALLAGSLMLGRFSRRRRLDDLLMALALMLFGFIDLGFLAVPAMFGRAGGRLPVWTALAGRTVAALALAVGAVGLPRRIRRHRAALYGVVGALAVLGLEALAVRLAGSHLPQPVRQLAPEGSGRVRLVAHPAAGTVQLVNMALFAVASVGLVRRARRDGDPFLTWLAAGSVLAAVARLQYFVYPSLYSDWVSSGDVFRLLFHVTILVGAGLEVRSYWRSQVVAAVLGERARMARDLHDGLAQELAYIKRNLQWLDDAHEVVAGLRDASERALIESRRAIAALAETGDRPLHAVLTEAVQDVAARERIQAIVDVDDDVAVTAEEQEALVRIACEAVTNAARHGQADVVRVQLRGDPLTMRISDAGAGFEPAAAEATGRFGLRGMQARATALGGHLRVSSTPGQGTEVEVEM